MCSLEPNCSSGPCESAAKAISHCCSKRIHCVSFHCVREHVCVCVCACACSSVCVFLFASHWFRVPRALVFFSGTWLSSKPEVLIRIKITFLKGRSFSAAAEC